GDGVWSGRRLVFDPFSGTPKQPAPIESRTYAYVRGTPIRYYMPQLEPAPTNGEAQSLKGRKILFLTDEPDRWLALEASGALAPFDYQIVCPSSFEIPKFLSVDVTSEDALQRSLQ